MAVEFEPLVFEIKQGSNDAAKGVDELTESLKKLKSATSNLSAPNHTASSLKKLNNTLKDFKADTLTKLASALETLNRVQNIKIPTSLSRNIAAISGALTIIKPGQVELLNRMSDGIARLQNVQNITIQKSLGDRLRNLSDAMNQMTEEGISRFERLAAALQQIGSAGNVHIPKMTVPTENTQTSSAPQTNVPEGPDLSAVTEGLDQVAHSVEQTITVTEGLSAVVGTVTQVGHVVTAVVGAIGEAIKFVIKVIRTFISVIKPVIRVMKKVISIAKNIVVQIGKAGAAITKTLLKPIIDFGSQIKKSISGVKQFFSSISRIAMYRLIRGAIAALTQGLQEGMKNLYQWSKIVGTDFADAMDRLATNALYVKNSLAAMVSPIIEAIAPAVDFLTDKFVELLNTVNMFIARLLGKDTYTVAKRVATVWEEVGENTEEATKKLKSYTIGIDELNIIEEPSSEQYSGWSPEEGFTGWFKELPTEENWITEFADKLKEFFENSDWEGLGRLLGDKVNTAIDAIDWDGIGEKIGYWLDAAIKTAYYFLKEIDFQKAGASVADLINSLLEAVDWEYLGRLLVEKITAMWDFAIGFLSELDWGEVGHSLFSFIIGALSEFSEWLDEIDWVSLGETLLEKLQDFFENFDWKEIIKTISSTLGKVMKSMKDLLTPLWNSFKAWWNEHIKGKDFLETIKNLGNYLAKFVDEYIMTPFIDAFFGGSKGEGKFDPTEKLMDNMRKYLKEGSTDTVDTGEMLKDIITDDNLSVIDKFKAIGQMIMFGILDGINLMVKDNWILFVLVEPFLWLVKKLFGISSPAKTMIPIGENLMLGLFEGLSQGLTAVLKFFTDLLESINNILKAGATLVVTAIDAASEVVKAIGQAAKDIIGAGAQLVVTAIDAASGVIEAVGNAVQGIVAAGANLVITAIDAASGVIEAIGQALVGIVSAGANLVITAIDAASGVIEAIGQAVQGVITAGANLIITAIDAASGVIEAVGQAAQDIVRAGANLVVTALDAASGVIEAVGQAARNIVTAGANLIVTATDAAGGVIEAVGQAARQVVDAGANLIITAMDTASSVIESVGVNVSDLMSANTNLVITATDAASSVISSIGSAVSGLIGAGANLIIAGIDNATSIVNAVGQNATQTIKGTESNVTLTATDNATPVINQVQSALDRLDKNITVTINIQVNGQIPTLHALGGVAHATGGIVPHATGSIIARPTITNYRGTTHLFGEAGKEAILPLDSYTGWMDEVADRTRQALEDESGFEENSFGRALTAFYTNYLEPVMSRMDDNMQRQADKTDQPVVRISGRDVRNAYDNQRKSDGFSFTR